MSVSIDYGVIVNLADGRLIKQVWEKSRVWFKFTIFKIHCLSVSINENYQENKQRHAAFVSFFVFVLLLNVTFLKNLVNRINCFW
jgi:hypothetical protein